MQRKSSIEACLGLPRTSAAYEIRSFHALRLFGFACVDADAADLVVDFGPERLAARLLYGRGLRIGLEKRFHNAGGKRLLVDNPDIGKTGTRDGTQVRLLIERAAYAVAPLKQLVANQRVEIVDAEVGDEHPAAPLIGERGTTWNAVVLGIVVTLTHTWSVILLGLVTLFASERISEERLSFWLGIVSGLLIVGIGIALFLHRYATFLLARHGSGDAHSHAHDHGRSHVVETKENRSPSYWNILGLGISGGIVPCPTALIILLLATKFGRLHYGMCLILAFSFGLALVLIALGIAVVRASGMVRRMTGEGRTLLFLPVLSSTAIIFLGLWVVL